MVLVRSKLSAICVTYTAITAFSSIVSLAQGRSHDTHAHLLMRLAICAIAFGSLYVFEWLERFPVLAVMALHFLGTLGLVFALVWVYGLVGELHPNAYRDVFLNYCGIYLVFAVFFSIRVLRREKAAR
jgi:heme A synthase